MRFRLGLLMMLASTFACGAEPLVGTYTSDIVQRQSCETVGDRPESCTRNEATNQVRVTLREGDDQGVVLVGVPLLGLSDRSVYGSEDNQGGYLFENIQRSENSASGCTVVRTTTFSLTIGKLEEGSSQDDICIPLLGRETQVTEVSAECDDIRPEPLAEVRTLRRRWERSPTCGLAEQ